MAKKKSLFSELVEKRAYDDRKFTTLNASRWSFGYQVIRANIFKVIMLNFLLIISAVPVILLYLRRFATINASVSINPFSANLGFGYMPYTSLVGLEKGIVLKANEAFFKFLPLASILFGIVFSGALYVTRNMLWLKDDVKLFRDILVGIKKNWGVVVLTFVYAVIVSLCFMSISYSDYTAAINGANWTHTLTKVVCYVAIALFGLIYLNASIMSVTYKVKFFGLIKNSFLISAILLPVHAFILIIAVLPMVLIPFGSILMTIGLALTLFFGLEYFVFVWSCYSHWIYEKFLQDATKNSTNAKQNEKDNEAEEKTEIHSKPQVISVLPIKPLSEDDPEVRQIPVVYTFADVEAIEESKTNMRRDSDEYAEKIKSEQAAAEKKEAEAVKK